MRCLLNLSSCMYLAVKFLVATNCRTWQEKQDLEVEFLRGKLRDLSSQAEGLQWQLEEVEERSRTETAQLQVTTAFIAAGKGGGKEQDRDSTAPGSHSCV